MNHQGQRSLYRVGKSGDLKTLLLDSLNWKDKFKDWKKKDCTWEDYMVETSVAHRVSKFEKIDNVKRPETPNPHWGLVYDENYDGALVGCVGTFFGTTRYKNCLPDKLPYPIGGISSQKYDRMTMVLPSEAVKLWYQRKPYYTKPMNQALYTYQVIIVLTTQEEDEKIFENLPEYYEPLEGVNPFIYKNGNKWMTNNLQKFSFGDIQIQYSVNLFVLKGPPKSWVVKWSKEGVEKMEKKLDTSFDMNEMARKTIALKVLKQWAAYFKMRTAKKREEEMTERFGAMKAT
ncbi:unnamed protein product, partial [Mesorhabditis belari]|uniref:Uncharacterized protein n=1 Tax=Mesorhabditis belari TaxID=2138241 RepID=A0AAF3F717_9BILA